MSGAVAVGLSPHEDALLVVEQSMEHSMVMIGENDSTSPLLVVSSNSSSSSSRISSHTSLRDYSSLSLPPPPSAAASCTNSCAIEDDDDVCLTEPESASEDDDDDENELPVRRRSSSEAEEKVVLPTNADWFYRLTEKRPIPSLLPRPSLVSRLYKDRITTNTATAATAAPKSAVVVYKGIGANPPAICTIQDDVNVLPLHSKAWLEVLDAPQHRYGKHLRIYYHHWRMSLDLLPQQQSQGAVSDSSFWDWLDHSKELPDLPSCPREKLDSDTVRYVTCPHEQESYRLTIHNGIVYNQGTTPVQTGPTGWMFVVRNHQLYGAPKMTNTTTTAGGSGQRFHHSSFFAGQPVAAAGILVTSETGALTQVYPHSGHYRPAPADLQSLLWYLHEQLQVDLRTIQVDTQQLFHVSRSTCGDNNDNSCNNNNNNNNNNSSKRKKVDSLYLQTALFVSDYLAFQARMQPIEKELFTKVNDPKNTQ